MPVTTNQTYTSIGMGAAQAASPHQHTISMSQMPGHYSIGPNGTVIWTDQYGASYPVSSPPYLTGSSVRDRAKDTLLYRLGNPDLGKSFLHVVEGDEKTFVFAVVKDQGLCLEDERAMFPSDTLVAQLRLILEAGK